MLNIKEKNIIQLKEKYGWEGEGTLHNPIIIDKNSQIESFFLISSKQLYIVIKNIDANCLDLKKCRNIRIENCNFKNLYIGNCEGIILKDNTISHFIMGKKLMNNQMMNNEIEIQEKERKHTYLIVLFAFIATLMLIFNAIFRHYWYAILGSIFVVVAGTLFGYYAEEQRFCLKEYFEGKKRDEIEQ